MRKTGLALGLVLALAIAAAPASANKGDLFLADYSAGAVLKVDPSSGAVSTVVSDTAFYSAAGVEFAPDGSLLVADYDQIVYRVDPDDGSFETVVASPLLANPTNAVVAPGGEIYLTDQAAVFRAAPDGGVSEVASGGDLDFPSGLVATAAGKLITPNRQPGGPVFSIDPRTGAQAVIADGDPFVDPFHLDRAPNGTTYVADTGVGVIEIPRDGSPRVVSDDPRFDDTYGIAVAPSRNLYVADWSDGQLFEVDPRSGDATLLVDSGEGLSGPLAVAVEPPRCKGKLATIVGSTKRDKLKGSKFKDVIHTLGGNDKVNAGKGNDIVCGGKGKDKLKGGKGKDKLFGQAGKDRLNGGPGKDKERQ